MLPIVHNDRTLLKMGDLISVNLDNDRRLFNRLKKAFHETKTLHLILFNDLLLVTKKKRYLVSTIYRDVNIFLLNWDVLMPTGGVFHV